MPLPCSSLPSPTSPRAAADFLRAQVPEPAFGILALTLFPEVHLVACQILTPGAHPGGRLAPQTILREALRLEAQAFVLFERRVGNKDPRPGPDDLALARALRQGGQALGMPLLDHLLVGDGQAFDGWYSFRVAEGWVETHEDSPSPQPS